MDLGLGAHVKEIRNEKKITLKEVSDATGLSTSFLSQFERGISTIAIDSLIEVAKALDVDIHDLIDSTVPNSEKKDQIVLNAFQRGDVQILSENQMQTSMSAYSADKAMMARKITLLPSAEPLEPVEYKHEGEEFIYILEGILTLQVEKEQWQLAPGATAHFASNKKHIWFNDTNKTVEFLIVNIPNSLGQSK